MNAIITGFSGYLGRYLTKFLESKGWSIYGINSKLCNLIEWTPQEISCIISQCDTFCHLENVDYIFHLAAVAKAGDWHLYNKGDVWLQNQKINTNILEFWKTYCPQAKMITMGTSCSYSPDLPLIEGYYLTGLPESGLSTYAFTKRMLLVGLRSLSDQYGLKFNYLIPSTIYGPGFEENDSHFIFDLIKKIYAGKYYNKEVILWGTGEQKRELIYIDDVVNNIYKCLSFNNQVLNIGYGKEFSIKSYAKLICSYLDYDFNNIKFDTSKYVGVQSKQLNITEIKEIIPEYHLSLTGLNDGIEQTINYYKELKNVRT